MKENIYALHISWLNYIYKLSQKKEKNILFVYIVYMIKTL